MNPELTENPPYSTYFDDTCSLEDSAIPLQGGYSCLDHIENGFAIVQNDELIYSNKAFKNIFNVNSGWGCTLHELWEEVSQSTLNGDAETLGQLQQPTQIEFQSARTHNWYNMTVTPVAPAAQRLVLVCTDISAFRRRDELLSFAGKMQAMGRLAGGVAHDFNNILSIVEGYTRLMIKQPEIPSLARDQMERILVAVRRGAAITRQLLSLGRHNVIASGHVNLNQLVKEQISLLLPLVDVTVKLKIVCPDEPVYVMANSDTLAQILMNAVTNARDAIENGGVIILRVSTQRAGFATLSVEDSGSGMDEATLKQAIEPFFTTKAVGKGTGLGLSQIYGLLQQIGGDMELESEVGVGTRLIMNIPLSTQDDAQHITQEENPSTWHGQTVLVVDDEPDLLVVMEGILKEKGFTVLTASSGFEALALQDSYEQKIDWLLSDVVMGDMSGAKLGNLIQSVRPEIQVIFMSGYPATGQMARIQLPHDSLFLAKPIDPDQLTTIMEKLRQDRQQNPDGLAWIAGAATWDRRV